MLKQLGIAAIVGAIACLGSGAALAAPRQPAATVKWNPGHYGASGGIAQPGDPLSKFSAEMDDMLRDDWIVGYRITMTWSALDAGPVTFSGSVGGASGGSLTTPVNVGSYWVAFENGEYRQVRMTDTTTLSWNGALSAGNVTHAHLYTTDLLDRILARAKTHYGKPRQLVVTIVPMSFKGGSRRPADDSRIPKYITNDSANGPSPDDGSYGWWGPKPGDRDGAYSAALYRPSVARQYAELGKALGAKYDSDPNFEALMDQETSAVTAPATRYRPADATYSDDAYVTQMQMYLSAWLAAFPHTNIIVQNTWLARATATQEFEAWMMSNRIAPGTADVSGQSYYDLGHPMNNWGLQAYAGQTADGSKFKGPDLRGRVRPMVDVEGPDIGSASGQRIGATPLDIVNALNKSVKASHAFWCHVPAGAGPHSPPKWGEVTTVLKNNPLTATAYPGNYPQQGQ